MDDKQKKNQPARATPQAAGGGVDGDAGMRRQQDLAAEIVQLEDALREARLSLHESHALGEALERGRRDALAEADVAKARAEDLQRECEDLRRQFESRIAELRAVLDSLRPQAAAAPPRRVGTD